MRVLITGGAGFVGTNIIKRLISKDHYVISIDNYNTGKKENHIEGAVYLNHDMRNIADYSFIGQIDCVFHMAAIARIQPSFKEPYDYFTTNVNATFVLAEYCAKNGIPLVYAGSSSHHSGKFKNPYTFSKDIGEDVIKLFQEHYNLKASITRFYNVYGPHQLKEGAYCTLIGIWENCIQQNKPFIIYGDGTKRRDFTHVEDIVDAMMLIFEKQSWGHIFELGRGKNYSIKEIADMFGKIPIYEPDRLGEAQTTLCTDTLAKELLGWTPKLNIEDYIKIIIN